MSRPGSIPWLSGCLREARGWGEESRFIAGILDLIQYWHWRLKGEFRSRHCSSKVAFNETVPFCFNIHNEIWCSKKNTSEPVRWELDLLWSVGRTSLDFSQNVFIFHFHSLKDSKSTPRTGFVTLRFLQSILNHLGFGQCPPVGHSTLPRHLQWTNSLGRCDLGLDRVCPCLARNGAPALRWVLCSNSASMSRSSPEGVDGSGRILQKQEVPWRKLDFIPRRNSVG